MKLLKYIFSFIVSVILLTSCDDETATLGVDMMPTNDLITKNFETYDVTTESYAVGDSVLARTSMSYLGRFTDPETGTTIKSDFLAQYHCTDNFTFPDSIVGDSCVDIKVLLYISNFVGDSLATFKLSVYELTKQLNPEADYYTNINPEKYYDKNDKPIATKWFTISDRSISDSLRWSSGYNNNISIALPRNVGTQIIKGYRDNPKNFSSASNWLNSGLPCSKGFYFKLESGDGAMAYIDISQMNLYFKYYDEEYKKDTLGMCQFAATEEVIQATRFENSNLGKLLEDKSATYLKSPAGIFTMATLPVDQINVNDTVNSAKLTFTRYNDKVQNSSFKLDIPSTLLLVRLDDYKNGFFENYNLSDNKTSYLATFNPKNNSYEFSNIARLLTNMVKEKNDGTATENWNKVLLIPVETTKDATTSIVKLNHDFSMTSARLVGGENDKVKMEVIYSTFNRKN
ncbi:MAG: DUF4270 domain-containing protein [Prevotellaceae bacterium]|nr:DUF4270 domain-containing protein [Candidatus Minthosoma caballi]